MGYALPVKNRYEMTENVKENEVIECPNHRDKICILRRLNKIKSSSGLVKSLKSDTDNGLSSCSNFPERPTLEEMEMDKPVLPKIEHLRGRVTDEQLEAIKDVLERNEEFFSRHKAEIGCCYFVEHEIELEEAAVPHREAARCMTPHKSDACRKEIETLLEYDMIEPSKSPWACEVVMAKKKGDQLRFCCDFRYLNSVTFTLRVDNRALSWLKTYSMDQSYIGRWIDRLDGYNMIIEQRTRDKHQNADSLSKKTEFYERQEQREANRPEIKEGFSFMDKETYDSLPLTRLVDKSGKPIEDHPELPKDPPEKTILKKTQGMPIGIMLRSKIVRETLKAKSYYLNQVETGQAQIDEDLMRLLEKLADDKPVIEGKGKDEPEVTILRRSETVGGENSLEESNPDGKEIVQSLVDKIPDDILEFPCGLGLGKRKWRFRRKLTTLEQVKSPGSGPQRKKMLEKKNGPGSVKNEMRIRKAAATTKIVCA